MATDATGTPTSLGIPKYNTSNDAPSGLGFNAAMDAIDALIGQRLKVTGAPVDGDVPVWDSSSSTWKPSSSKKPSGSELAYAAATSSYGATTMPTSAGSVVQALPAATYEAAKHYLEINLANVRTNTSGSSLFLGLGEGGALVSPNVYAQVDLPQTAANGAVVALRLPFTPVAGAHTYQVLGWASSGVPTFTLVASAAGPLVFRIVKA